MGVTKSNKDNNIIAGDADGDGGDDNGCQKMLNTFLNAQNDK